MVSKNNIKTSGEDFDNFLIEIGKKLKTCRNAKGYTSYEQFAFEHNIGRAQYGKYERGTEDMRLSTLFRVLNELDISWDEFFKDFKRKK